MLNKTGCILLFLVLVAGTIPACVLFEEIEYDEDAEGSDDSSIGNDYWINGYCPGNTMVDATMVSNNCNGITLAGCCDANGNALYCYQDHLYCQSCISNVQGQAPAECSWDAQNSYYWCTETDLGVDPSGTFLKACPAF